MSIAPGHHARTTTRCSLHCTPQTRLKDILPSFIHMEFASPSRWGHSGIKCSCLALCYNQPGNWRENRNDRQRRNRAEGKTGSMTPPDSVESHLPLRPAARMCCSRATLLLRHTFAACPRRCVRRYKTLDTRVAAIVARKSGARGPGRWTSLHDDATAPRPQLWRRRPHATGKPDICTL